MPIHENTVSAEKQMINSNEVSFLGDPKAPVRVLILGNSITRHGPKADIGWHGDWGMAASAKEKDYVHRFYAMLKASGRDVFIRIRQSAYWERHFWEADCLSRFADDREFGADIVIYRLGDNVTEENAAGYEEAVKQFMDYLGAKPGSTIFSTCWWDRPDLDEPIRRIAKARGDVCAETVCTDPATMKAYGKFEHGGVSAHPGDLGMEMIAQKLFVAFVSL